MIAIDDNGNYPRADFYREIEVLFLCRLLASTLLPSGASLTISPDDISSGE